MKAFIMSAGLGTRLRPLTYIIPKPMIPILNTPILEHVIDNLKVCGFNDVIINLHYKPQVVREYFGDGSKFGIKITYSYEKKILGTAGGVKKVEKLFDSTFLVLSCDGLSNISIKDVIDYHKSKGALGTMVLKSVDAKFDLGVAIVNNDGKIKEFVEKPNLADLFASTTNTGIYVFQKTALKYVPRNEFYDFGHQLWPKLLKLKKPIFGYVTEKYWIDIGNLWDLRKAHKDAIDGEIKLKIKGKPVKKGVWLGNGVNLKRGTKLIPPCIIGDGCSIEKGVKIGNYTVLGDNVFIEEGSEVINSIVMANSRIGKSTKIYDCIVGPGTVLPSHLSAFQGTFVNI